MTCKTVQLLHIAQFLLYPSLSQHSTNFAVFSSLSISLKELHSALWHCWLGVRKSIWSSWCHCHPSPLPSFKSRLVLLFGCQLTQVALEKWPLNECSSSSSLYAWKSASLAVWHSGTITGCINEVTQSSAHLVVRWVTICTAWLSNTSKRRNNKNW